MSSHGHAPAALYEWELVVGLVEEVHTLSTRIIYPCEILLLRTNTTSQLPLVAACMHLCTYVCIQATYYANCWQVFH